MMTAITSNTKIAPVQTPPLKILPASAQLLNMADNITNKKRLKYFIVYAL